MGDGLTFQSVICDSYSNKCRLCLGDSAVNVLLLKNKDGMLDLLSRSSGIDVEELSGPPNKFCEQCCLFALKLHSYRKYAAECNDFLKNVYNKQVKGNSEATCSDSELANGTKHVSLKSVKPNSYHVSLKGLLNKYPNIRIPPAVLKWNIDPVVKVQRRLFLSLQKTRKPKRKSNTRNRNKFLPNHKHVKKKRRCTNESTRNSITPKTTAHFQKAELIDGEQICPAMHKYIFTSSLELAPVLRPSSQMLSEEYNSTTDFKNGKSTSNAMKETDNTSVLLQGSQITSDTCEESKHKIGVFEKAKDTTDEFRECKDTVYVSDTSETTAEMLEDTENTCSKFQRNQDMIYVFEPTETIGMSKDNGNKKNSTENGEFHCIKTSSEEFNFQNQDTSHYLIC